MDNVCNRRLFSFPAKVEMAEEQEHILNAYFLLFAVDQNINYIALLLTIVLSPSPFSSIVCIELEVKSGQGPEGPVLPPYFG